MKTAGRWADLGPRLASAVVLVAVSLTALIAGGAVFHGFIALACGAMVWELARILDPSLRGRALGLGLLGGIAILAALWLRGWPALGLLALAALAIALLVPRLRGVAGIYGLLILLAGYEMIAIRDTLGLGILLWLILVVIASDVAGYFAGKAIGGPKFWPRISPKKTWSGTVAGWIGAALVGLGFVVTQDLPLMLVAVSMAVALAAQMGDIAESAIKRRVGVKDSSALIPGHGGVLDRFDGMLGGAVFVWLIGGWFGLPPGLF